MTRKVRRTLHPELPINVEAASLDGPLRAPDASDELALLRDDPELAELFISETLDHLRTIETALLALDYRPGNAELLNEIFRPFHTIKGNAAALGLSTLQKVAHSVENLLAVARAGAHPMGPPEIDLVLRAVDVLTLVLGDIGNRLKGRPPAELADPCGALQENIQWLLSGRSQLVSAAATASRHDSSDPADRPEGSRSRRFDDIPGQTAVKVDTRKLDKLVDIAAS